MCFSGAFGLTPPPPPPGLGKQKTDAYGKKEKKLNKEKQMVFAYSDIGQMYFTI